MLGHAAARLPAPRREMRGAGCRTVEQPGQPAAQCSILTNEPATCRHAKGWYRKALALQELGRLPEALAAARQCLELTAGIAQREAQQLLAALEDQAAQQPEPGGG